MVCRIIIFCVRACLFFRWEFADVFPLKVDAKPPGSYVETVHEAARCIGSYIGVLLYFHDYVLIANAD